MRFSFSHRVDGGTLHLADALRVATEVLFISFGLEAMSVHLLCSVSQAIASWHLLKALFLSPPKNRRNRIECIRAISTVI